MSTLSLSHDLSARINAEHEACLAAAAEALEHAMQAGDLLAEAKSQCEHGQWKDWLAENFVSSARTARVYMRLAAHRETIEAKRQSIATLGVSEVIRLIASPRADRRCPPESDDPTLAVSDLTAYEAMKQRHSVYMRNAQVYTKEVESLVDGATLNDIPGLRDGLKELTGVANGWAAFKLKTERALGFILNELDDKHGVGFGSALAQLVSTDAGYEAFQRALNERIAELEAA